MIYLFLDKHLLKGQQKGPGGRCSEACSASSKSVVWRQIHRSLPCAAVVIRGTALHAQAQPLQGCSAAGVALVTQLNVPGCPWVCVPVPCRIPFS